MPSTFSTNLKIELMATGENSGTWGTVTNTNLGTALEQAVVGYGNPNYSSDANLTITLTDSNAAQAARALVLNVTSSVSLTGTRELVVPTIQKQYIVQNNTTGSQSITVKTSAGTGITIPNGKKMHVYVDGTNVVQMDDFALIFNVDNLTLDGNTLSSTDTNGNIVIAPNGTGDVQLDADTIRVGDSAAAVTLTSNGAGALTVTTGGAADLVLNTNSGTNSGSITIGNSTNGNITVATNGTGDFYVDADTVRIGDSNANATLTTNGTGDLILNTNSGTNSGSITIEDGVNGNIIIAPNGTGQVQITNAVLDLTTLEVTNIKAKDGTAALSIADSTGAVTVSTLLNVDNLRLDGNTLSSTNTNGAINLTPNGTGQVTVTNDALINSITVGRGAGAVATNTAVGYQAGYSNTTGTDNLFLGYQAGYSNQTGAYGTFLGYQAGQNATGLGNTLIGYIAGQALTTGVQNNFIGTNAGYLVTTGSKNVVLGQYTGNQGGLDIRTASNYIVLSDGDGNPRQIIDSSGNLGLGVTPSAWKSNYKALEVGRLGNAFWGQTDASGVFVSSNAYLNSATQFIYANTAVATYYTQNSGQHQWYTAPSGTAGNAITFTQAMTLDASGNLLVGGTSNIYGASNRGTIQLQGNTATYGFVISGTDGGYVNHDGSNINLVNTKSGYIQFSTAGTERARITAGGDLYVGTQTALNGTARLDVLALTGNNVAITAKNDAGANQWTMQVWNAGTSGDNAFVQFATETAYTGRGSITYNRGGGQVAYNTTSDYRAKDLIGPVQNSGQVIDALKVYTGKMKGATIERPMLVAHEAQEVTPYAVTGEKDAVNEDGTPKYQQMDVSSLVPLLLAEIQSLRARVAQLEGK